MSAPAPALPELQIAGDVPQSDTALLLIDWINPLQFVGADALAGPAVEAAQSAARLKQALAGRGVPAIYVNDNFGAWTSDFRDLVRHCRGLKGAPAHLARLMAPRRGDLTLLKPRHSAFHATSLALLLAAMGARKLILAGVATDLCIQFSAMDAFQRGYALWVPADCTAAESVDRKLGALEWMERALKCHAQPAWAQGAGGIPIASSNA